MKKIKALQLISALALLASFGVHAAPQQTEITRDKVVIQVSDALPEKWNLALNNARNVQEAVGKDKVDVEIVAYGPGIEMLKMESEVGNKIDKAMAEGVKIVACQNTMKARKLTPSDMLPSIAYVPAGVVEIIRKQQQGWAYLRP
ncbi:MAG: DsrE family protein [Proteobacteria bacterium]|nr:DsrE family protein [Pseudomonadota bacterium]